MLDISNAFLTDDTTYDYLNYQQDYKSKEFKRKTCSNVQNRQIAIKIGIIDMSRYFRFIYAGVGVQHYEFRRFCYIP